MIRTFLDTNVVSELFRKRPNAMVIEKISQLRRFAVSAVVIEEVEFGIAHFENREVSARWEQLLSNAVTIYEVSDHIARISGQLRGRLRNQGRTLTQADAIIAATAVAFNLTLWTRNTKDFEYCGIALFNPF